MEKITPSCFFVNVEIGLCSLEKVYYFTFRENLVHNKYFCKTVVKKKDQKP